MYCFETIRNNTALKLKSETLMYSNGFETIRNNTALKLMELEEDEHTSFETIRNNTALKLASELDGLKIMF